MGQSSSRVFTPGAARGLREAVQAELGQGVEPTLPEELVAGDLVILDPDAAAVRWNAFSTCRAIKRAPRVRVFICIAADDPFGEEIARFCMADGVIRRGADGFVGLDRLHGMGGGAGHGRPSVDSLLDRYEARLQDDPARAASGLSRLEAALDTGSVAARFTDAETGLFDAAFAGFKLDEELKRAIRFHQPLALLLLDCGVDAWPDDEDERRTTLAEVASVFLEECRDIDVLARFSSSVFLFLLPGTGPDGAVVLARRMVESLGERSFSSDVRLSPRVGIAAAPHPEVRDRSSFVRRAERALASAIHEATRVAVAERG